MITILSNALVPIFVGLLLGYIAGLLKTVDNRDVKSLNTFLLTYALPCSLFITIAHTPHELLWGQVKVGIVLTIVYLAVYIPTFFIARTLGKSDIANSSVTALTLAFPNNAAVGIPLLLAAYGTQAAVTVVVAIAIGAVTVTPITLALLESATSTDTKLSHAAHIRIALWRALQKPVFWAPVLGLFAAIVQFHLPAYLDKSVNILGSATEGVALFVTGLIASAQRFTFTWAVGWSVLTKNAIQPALCLGAAILMGMPLDETKYVVLICAIPCGFFGILFGESFHTTPEVASSSLIASTVLAIFTLAGWIVILSHVH